jgi:hypothetical protein
MGGEAGSSPAGGKVGKELTLAYLMRHINQYLICRVVLAKTRSDLLQSNKSSMRNSRIQTQTSKSTVMQSARYAHGNRFRHVRC